MNADKEPRGLPSACMGDFLSTYIANLTSGKPRPRYETGLIPLVGGRITVIGAPPGRGKSTLAWQMTMSALNKTDTLTAGLCSTEMGPEFYFGQAVARAANIPLTAVQNEQLTKQQVEMLMTAAESMQDMSRVWMCEKDSDSLRRMVKEHQPGLVMIDYLQKLEISKGHRLDDRQRVAVACAVARDIADGGAAVLLVAAVSRQKDKSGKSGYAGLDLASFRDSSAIEYCADSAYILHREPSSCEARLQCVKNRYGPVEDVDMVIEPSTQTYRKMIVAQGVSFPADAQKADI